MKTSPSHSSSERIYRHALKDAGLKELPGSKSAPRIRQSILAAASWLDPDDSETAWCGCIRGTWGLETGTGIPPQHYRAAAWLNWGEPVPFSLAQPGDTVILRRSGGKHVALFEKWVRTERVQLFGGNQSNACNSKPFDRSDILDIRRLS